MKIRKNLIPESLYNWKSPYKMIPTRIVVHNTANDASADNEIKYMHRDQSNGVQVSYHYAVDDKEIVQGLPEDRNGWHASDGTNGKANREGIGIEICYSKSGGERFIKAEENAVELIVDILKRYNWDISKVTKHQDYTNKKCPHRTLEFGWDRFLNMIKSKLDNVQSIGMFSTIQSWYNLNYSDKLGTIEVDNSFGPDTKKHLIKALQYEMNKQYRCTLEIDGSFGQQTKKCFKNLKSGVFGNITRICQAFLYNKNYNPNGFDGMFGSGMKKAVESFQKNNNISVDGILGKNTAYKLFN